MTSDDLASVLTNIGVDIRRSDGKEITGRCPVHHKVTGREDRSPSWSMNSSTGLWLCFSCGAKGTLSMLVSELTGDPDSILSVHRLIIEASLNSVASPKVTHEVPVDWVAFGKFTKVPDRMTALKNLDSTVTWKFGIRWDTTNKCWVIPIVSPMGELRGWQSKKTGWVRNYPEGVKKSETLFGIERFTSDTAVLVESPLDVVRMGSLSLNSQGLASFGTSVSDSQIRILSNHADRLIVAMDNDAAGLSASKRLASMLPYFRKGIFWFNYGNVDAKDIGDMDDDDIISGIERASLIPPWVR